MDKSRNAAEELKTPLHAIPQLVHIQNTRATADILVKLFATKHEPGRKPMYNELIPEPYLWLI